MHIRSWCLLFFAIGMNGGWSISTGQAQDVILLKQFRELAGLRGEAYARSREDFLARGGAEGELADIAADDSQNAKNRLLASVMLARLRSPDEFRRLEGDLQKKAGLFTASNARVQQISFHHVYLFDPKESRKFCIERQLVDSTHWDDVAREILLQGWSLPPDAALQRPDLRDLIKRQAPINRLGRDAQKDAAGPHYLDWIYVRNAVYISSVLKDRRAVPLVRELLADQDQNYFVRQEALFALHRIADSDAVPILVRIVKEPLESNANRELAMDVLVNIDGEHALPVLREVASRNADPLSTRARSVIASFLQEPARKRTVFEFRPPGTDEDDDSNAPE